jgi:hypothetical protein
MTRMPATHLISVIINTSNTSQYNHLTTERRKHAGYFASIMETFPAHSVYMCDRDYQELAMFLSVTVLHQVSLHLWVFSNPRSWQHSSWPDTRTAVSNVKNRTRTRSRTQVVGMVGWTRLSSYSSVVKNGDSKTPIVARAGTEVLNHLKYTLLV